MNYKPSAVDRSSNGRKMSDQYLPTNFWKAQKFSILDRLRGDDEIAAEREKMAGQAVRTAGLAASVLGGVPDPRLMDVSDSGMSAPMKSPPLRFVLNTAQKAKRYGELANGIGDTFGETAAMLGRPKGWRYDYSPISEEMPFRSFSYGIDYGGVTYPSASFGIASDSKDGRIKVYRALNTKYGFGESKRYLRPGA